MWDRALQAADPRLLIATLVSRTGSTSWLDERFTALCGDGAADMLRLGRPPIDWAATEAGGDLLAAAGCLACDSPADVARIGALDDGTLDALIALVSGVRLDARYRNKLRADVRPLSAAPARREGPAVTIVGAGLAGIAVASALLARGVEVHLLEKNAGFGGVWFENSYPECGLDTHAHLYSLDRDLEPDWTRAGVKRDEVLAYVDQLLSHHGLAARTSLNSEVIECRYRDAAPGWELTTRASDGALTRHSADIVVFALGILNRPRIPAIPGAAEYAGRIFHTARWPADFDPTGRRIALIGTGSSGVQVARHLAERAQHLVIIQRSPTWIAPAAYDTRPYSPQLRWLLRAAPTYRRWFRFQLYWLLGDARYERVRRDAADPTRPSTANLALRDTLAGYLREAAPEALIERLTPAYPPYVKRLVTDNGWYAALTAPNVTLVQAPTITLDRDGVRFADGSAAPVDTVVLATGFVSDQFLGAIRVCGPGGHDLEQIVGPRDDVRAYLGVAVAGLPNLFCVQGPNSSAAHGGSDVYVAECQANQIAAVIDHLTERGYRRVAVSGETVAGYNAELERRLAGMIWNDPAAGSRYKNSAGRVLVNHPFTLQEFWDRTATLAPNAYHFD